MKRIVAFFAALALTSAAFAQQTAGQPTGSITTGTNSNAEQAVTVQVGVGGSGGATSDDVTYHGGYTVKSAPPIQAAALTASITETCWGSVSGGLSLVGVGVTAAATIKDYDCNRRLNAAVAGRMGRMDIAFNLMCQDDSFRAASIGTKNPCPAGSVIAKQGTEIVPAAKNDDADIKQAHLANNLPIASLNERVDPKTGMTQYRVADTRQ
jgi:hypothetical protein